MWLHDEQSRAGQSGASLVEVAVAMLILAVLAVGLGAFLTEDQATLSLQRNRRVALELANTRLEELRATSFSALVAMLPATNYNAFYFARATDTTWTNSATPIYENTNLNGNAAVMLTQVRLCGSSNYLALTVNVNGTPTNNYNRQVMLQTYYFGH